MAEHKKKNFYTLNHESEIMDVFRCLFCDLDFREEEHFHNHDSNKHFKAGKFHCVCNEGFSEKRDAVHHFMTEHKKRNSYPCKECTESLFGKQELKTHLKDVHAIKVKPHQCPVCLDDVRHDAKSGSLRNHMYNKHNNVQFKCDICERNLTSKDALERHKIQIHSDEKIKYNCEKCSEEYYSKKSFENHVAKHNGEPAHACDKCNQKFYTSYYLERHKKETHGKQRFYCTQCEYSSKHSSGFKRHTKTLHSDERPFKCNFCESTFKTTSTMKSHTRIHTGERPFKCKYCDKTFKQHDHHRRHVAIHEQDYKFECKACGRKFIQGGNYRLHMRTHHATDKAL